MEKRRKNRGFTLIELVVVIAIIGVIASVVLVFLGEARARSNDTKVKSQLTALRTALENHYTTNGQYVGVVVTGGSGGASTNIGPGCASGIFASAEFSKFTLSANYPATAANTGRCSATNQAYAVSVRLDEPNTFWCIDSRNTSKQTGARHNASTYVCP